MELTFWSIFLNQKDTAQKLVYTAVGWLLKCEPNMASMILIVSRSTAFFMAVARLDGLLSQPRIAGFL